MHPLTRRCCGRLGCRSLPILRVGARPWTSLGSFKKLYVTPPTWLARQKHDAASQKADAIVIGGGPAGIAVVGNLLETIPRGKVVWIDRSFQGGSIGQFYREVPSYSPAGDFLQYARVLKTFRDINNAAPPPNAITALQGLEPEMTCPLDHAADMLQLVSDGLLKHERVESVLGTVTQAARNPRTKQWTITLHPPEIGHAPPTPLTYLAPLVVYCTGSSPRAIDLPAPVSRLTVETCLAPSRLAKLLPADEPRTIAVVGSGHSAVLALRNLFRLAVVSHRRLRIRWFTRDVHLKYAERLEEEAGGVDGVVVNENDGLMGEAAMFARTQLEGERLGMGDAAGYITRFVLPVPDGRGGTAAEGDGKRNKRKGAAKGDAEWEKKREALEREAMREHMEGVDYVVQCIGFTRSRLPEVRPGLGPLEGPIGKPKRLVFNGLTGSFFPNGGPRDQVIGLFGAGSAFPELEFTSQGWRQPAVGVWKFMKFAQRMVPRWVAATERGWFVSTEDRARMIRRGNYREFY